jgi:excisionase family DNA binding protein
MPAFLTAQEAADVLRVSMSTIARWRSTGRLPFQRVGVNGVRFRLEHVTALVTEGTPSPAAPQKSWQATRHRDSDELPSQLMKPIRRVA